MMRRLNEEEITFLSNLPKVDKSVIINTFKDKEICEDYDFNFSMLILDAYLFRWNQQTIDAVTKGFKAIFNGNKIIKEEKKK